MKSLKKDRRSPVPGFGRFLSRVAVSGIALAMIAAVLGFVGATGSTANATGTSGGDNTCEWVREIPQSHQEYKYKKTIPGTAGVKEYKYKKSVKTYKTQHWAKYQKYVKGRVEKKSSGSWRDTGTDFDWTKWEGSFWNTNGSFKVRDWADTASPDVIEEGGHSSVSDTFTQNGYTYRWVSERYSYRVIDRDTKQVETGSTWEYSEWTTEVRGSPWAKVDERWKVQPVPEQTVWYNNGNWTTDTPGSPWVKADERTVQDPPIKQGPVRSATEPDRGQYPNVPWTKVPGSCTDGKSSFIKNCESITLNTPVGVTPTGSEFRYLIDGVVKPVGTHLVPAGEHTITLEVKVGGVWEKVDEDKVTVEVCPTGGTSKFETSCNTLKLYAPTGVVPQGAEFRYLLDGVVKTPGTYTLPAGSYQLVLETKVNGTWRQVDQDTVVIEDCKPMPAASGTVDCSGFVVNLDNTKGEAPAPFTITKPDGTAETVTVPASQTALRTYPVIEDQTATVTVKSEAMNDFTLSFAADCVKTPPPPPVNPPTPPTPTPECPPGKQWNDDGDNVMEPGECQSPPKVKKPKAKVKAHCVTERFGEGVAVLNNKKSTKKVTFRIVRSGPDAFVTVKAGAKKKVVLTGLRVGSVVKVKADSKTLAKTKVPRGCSVNTPPPNTGARTAAGT